MYLREMGGVELLSREDEIAIAKRIEAGKDVMLNALTQSPLVARKIYEWKDAIIENQLLVRDIIDITQLTKILKQLNLKKKKKRNQKITKRNYQ